MMEKAAHKAERLVAEGSSILDELVRIAGNRMNLIKRLPKRMQRTFKTRNGETLSLRLMRPDDAQRLEDFFYKLSSETRWRRFHVLADNVSPEEVRRRALEMADVDNRTYQGAVVAVAGDRDNGEIIGVVRLSRPPGQPDSPEAEAAVVVRDDYHGQGVGTHLLRQLVPLARRMKVRTIVAVFQPDNENAIRLFRNLGLPYKMVVTQGVSKMYQQVDE
jgi:RimJ/RimL family protein N-acetyltransferase